MSNMLDARGMSNMLSTRYGRLMRPGGPARIAGPDAAALVPEASMTDWSSNEFEPPRPSAARAAPGRRGERRGLRLRAARRNLVDQQHRLPRRRQGRHEH